MKYLSLYFLITILTLPTFAKKEKFPQWISAADKSELNADLPQYFYYRSTFKSKKQVKQVVLKVISHNNYCVWVNGIPVILDGQSTLEEDKYLADTVWLKDYIIKGMNTIAVKTRIIPEKSMTYQEGIYVHLFKDDSINIMSDDTWICGIDDALKISSEPAYKLEYDASADVFSGFSKYRYTDKVRGKDKWKAVTMDDSPSPISEKCKAVKLVKTERTHRFTGVEMPKFLKESLDIDWDIDFKTPVYFGFKVESIGSKKIMVLLDTKEFGLVELLYHTKEGSQEFVLDIPLTISKASVKLPVYLKINNVFYKESQN